MLACHGWRCEFDVCYVNVHQLRVFRPQAVFDYQPGGCPIRGHPIEGFMKGEYPKESTYRKVSIGEYPTGGYPRIRVSHKRVSHREVVP